MVIIFILANTSVSKFQYKFFDQLGFVACSLLLVSFAKRIDHGLDLLSVYLDSIQEVEKLIVAAVWKHKHVLRERLEQRHGASLCIEPGICTQFLLEWLETLDDSAHTETVVTFSAIQCTNNKVNDTEVEHLSLWLFNGYSILLLLNTFHKLFSISILRHHNV